MKSTDIKPKHKGGRPREGKYLKCPTCEIDFYVNQRSRRKYCGDKCARDAVKNKVFNKELGLKRCALCEEWKALDEYPNANNRTTVGTHGKQAYCRPCNLIKCNEWTDKNPETRRAHRQKAYWKDPEKMRALKRERNSTPEGKERRMLAGEKYRKANPEKIRDRNKARIHTLRGIGKVTRQMLVNLKALQKNRCAVCRVTFDKSNRHLDHIKPISAGGTNEFGNLQFLCANCNLTKSARDPIEFMQSKGFLL